MKQTKWIKHVITLFVICLFGILAAGSGDSGSSGSSTKTLNLTVRFSNTQIQITNNESVALTNVRMRINDDYIYEVSRIEPNSTNEVGMGVFTLKDGTRFNPFQKALKSFSVHCSEGDAYYTPSN